MARRRVDEQMLVALLAFFAGAAARPAIDTERRQSTSLLIVERAATNQPRELHFARLTQDGQPEKTIADHGGFSTASIVSVAIFAAFTIAVIVSLSYAAYYCHAKLKLQKQLLERLVPSTFHAQNQQAGVFPEVAVSDVSWTTQTAATTNSLAVLMSSSAQPSPASCAALQEEQLKSSIAPVEAKAKAVTEDKVLGRRQDIMPLGS